MSQFVDLQNRFQGFVLSGQRGMDEAIVGDDLAPADERLAVYFDAYRLRLLGILQTEFPGVRALTTSEQFREVGQGYLAAYPSSYSSVRWFARHFADYLETAQERLDVPNLAEMAHFEWARGRAFDAVDSPVLAPEQLAQLPPDRWPAMKIEIAPSARQVPFRWNTDELYRSIHADVAVPPARQRNEAATCCIWRHELTVYWRVMDAPEAAALSGFARGQDFAQVCVALCATQAESEVPALAASMLSGWIGEGLVAAINA